MPKKPRAMEGRVIGEKSDRKFHDPILGKDKLPPDLLEMLKKEAREIGVPEEIIDTLS